MCQFSCWQPLRDSSSTKQNFIFFTATLDGVLNSKCQPESQLVEPQCNDKVEPRCNDEVEPQGNDKVEPQCNDKVTVTIITHFCL